MGHHTAAQQAYCPRSWDFSGVESRHMHCTRGLGEAPVTQIHRSLDHVVREQLRARLRDARSQLLRTAATTEEELATLQAREPGAPIEGATREEVIGILARLEDRERREMEEIDAAFVRLRVGTYGVCETCGRSIPLPRLRAMPATRHCVTCQVIRE
jgi:DnaK suppressor protein